jgi:hypothetical protein
LGINPNPDPKLGLQYFIASGQLSGIENLKIFCAGIFKQSMGARNRVGLGLPARTQSLAEFVSWNRFLGALKV